YGNHVRNHHQGVGEIDKVLDQLQGSHSGKDDHQHKKHIVPLADLGIGQKPKALYPVIGIGEKRGQGKGGHNDHQKDPPVAIKGILKGIQGHDDPTALFQIGAAENDDHRRKATDHDGVDERAQHGHQTFLGGFIVLGLSVVHGGTSQIGLIGEHGASYPNDHQPPKSAGGHGFKIPCLHKNQL